MVFQSYAVFPHMTVEQNVAYGLKVTGVPADETRRRVKEEGVRSILGAPVRSDGRIIGALMVADRNTRHFDADEVTVLESLAYHVASVLENAWLLERLRKKLDRSERAYAEANRRLGELRRVERAEGRLLASFGLDGGSEQFAEELGEIFDNPAIAIAADPHTMLIDRSALQRSVPDLEQRLAESSASGEAVSISSSDEGEEMVLVPAVVGGRLLGVVGMLGVPDSAQLLILQRAAIMFSALVSARRTWEVVGAQERAEVLEALFVGRPGPEYAALARRAGALGLDTSGDLMVVVIEPVAAPIERTLGVVENWEDEARRSGRDLTGCGVIAVKAGRICAVLNVAEANAEVLAADLARGLAARGVNATVVAEPAMVPDARALSAIPAAYENALAVLSTALLLGRRGEACTQAMLGLASLVVSGDMHRVTPRIIRHAIGPLVEHDESRGTSYVETALAFLEAGQRVSSCAEQLYVHENTVRQRLARLDEILGPEWRRGQRMLDTHLALRLHQLTRSNRGMI